MGLKGAPSYFQHVMQSEVLQGLQYDICEIYIDDIIIFADSEEDLVKNLRKVLERLTKYNITVSPEKCSFGMSEVEFVGHVIDDHGITFSNKKLYLINEMR
jgi:molybdopterin-biosynthesis enzyme MoeA-like protein